MTIKHKKINTMLIVHNIYKSHYQFIIDWAPKAGCTVVCKIFFDYMDELEKSLKYDDWIHNLRPKYYKKYGKVDEKLLLSNNFIKIKFVRNPYSRAVSSYIHVMKTHLKNNFNNEDMSFYTFLLYLEKKNYPSDPHYAMQMCCLEKEDTFDHIIKIENLEKEIKNLNKLYNLNYDFSSSHHVIKHTSNINVSNVKFSQISNTPTYNNFYDKNLVFKLYKDDIIRYNYTFEDFLQTL